MLFRLIAAAVAAAGWMAVEAQEAQLGIPPRVDLTRVKTLPDSALEVRTAGSGNWIDTSIRSEVVTAWNTSISATENTAMGWTGSVAGCVPGTTSATFRSAVATRINWFRGMAGVPTGITFNDTWNGQDQQAALMMSANNSLNHFPPASWTCYTAGGRTAAENSNICYSFNVGGDPGCVSLYIKDSGASNGPVGHRRWLLYPQTRTMGTGDVSQSGSNGRANAIWVFDGNFGTARPATRDEFVAWPPKGFVPYQTVFARWSFSYPNADFSSTVVTMSRGGSAVTLTKLPVETGYGENTLVWEPSVNLGVAGADSAVDVTLSNVLVSGQARTFTYRVTIIDPANTTGPPPPPEGLIDVTFESVPSGRTITVDGFLYTTPRTFQWVPDTNHTINTTAIQDRGITGERFVFANWSSGTAASQTITPSLSGTYTATFTTQYTLQTAVSPASSGSVNAVPAPVGGYYNSGQVVTLNAAAASGYNFSAWSGDAGGTNASTTITMTKPSTVTAVFALPLPPLIDVTFNSIPSGRTVIVDGTGYTTPRTFQWAGSSSHTISAATQSGTVAGERFVFASWSSGAAASQTIAPVAATTYTATFNTEYLLQTSASPGAGGSVNVVPSGNGGYYASGQVVTLSASAGPGYNFSNWSGDASGTNAQTTVTMTKPSAATATFVPVASSNSGLHFVPVRPCRIADTRDPAGPFGGPIMAGGQARSFAVQQSNCGIPSTAKAYSLNVTVVPSEGLGYLTIWPTGQAQPFVSTLNANDAQVTANAAIVPAGTAGAVSVFVTNPSHLVLDINGYFDDPGAPNALAFYPVTPCRIADTREAAGAFGGPAIPTGGTRTLAIRQSNCGLPASAAAYAFNLTVVPPGALGYITTWPTGQSQPLASTTNSYDGQVTANLAIVPAGTDGSVSFFASNQTHLVVDVMGYFAPPGAPNGLRFFPVAPCRIADTREPAGALGGPVMDAGAVRSFPFTQAPCGLPVSAKAYSANFTVVPSTILGYLTTWATGAAQPFVSTLNSLNGQITANAALVPAGTSAAVTVLVTDRSHVVIDTNGYFAP